MKTAPLLTPTLGLMITFLPLAGCEGESPTKAIPKTEALLNEQAITQVLTVAINSGTPLDASSIKSQIDPLIAQYGEAPVVDKLKELAASNDDPATRAAAVFAVKPYVDSAAYQAMQAALDEPARASFDELTN